MSIAPSHGLEPQFSDPESDVLPLDEEGMAEDVEFESTVRN